MNSSRGLASREMDCIYRSGGRYDLLFPGTGQDLEFWTEGARRYGDPILELACGTGRLAIPLASQGYRVTGLDCSTAMLDEARQKSAELGAEVAWCEADMRSFDLGETFSLITLPANALGHLLSLDDFEACLGGVKKHLAPGGRFVIDFFVPKMALLLDKPGEQSPFAEYEDPGGRGKVVLTESYVYEPHTEIKRLTIYQAVEGDEQGIDGELVIRMYFPQELDALIKYNGLTIEAKYGDYDQGPFGPESEKQLIVCSKS